MSLQAKSPNCRVHKIYCQILKNNPEIDKNYAKKLSNSIFKYAKKHKIPAKLYTAILMQESAYKLNAKNCSRGIREGKSLKSQDISVCADYGIAQINYKTLRRYSGDLRRIMTDMDYSVEFGAKVLSWFREKYSKKEPLRWFCRYNTGTASKRKIKKNCTKYVRLVSRWR